jgi:branched-chain amino acid transport system ATP-binding protein
MDEGTEKQPVLRVKNLTKSFGGLNAVNDVSFTINRGEIICMVGPNGSGKTTIFNLITGFLRADKGAIEFEDLNIAGWSPNRICHLGIGRTFQLAKPFSNSTVLENVMVGAFCRVNSPKQAREIANDILEQVGLATKAYSVAKNLTIANLKRLEVAKALATQCKLVLLDEVMAGLNSTEIGEALPLLQQLPNRGITVFFIEHVMAAVMNLAEQIFVLNHGRLLAEGTPSEIANNKKVIEAYLGERYSFS